MKGIVKGIKAYFGAIELISQLKLWNYFLIPMLISFVFALIITGISYGLSDDLGSLITAFWPLETGKEIVATVSRILAATIIIVVGVLSFKYIVLAISAPFMAPVSKKIEDHLTNSESKEIESTFFQLLIRGTRISIRNFFREIILTIPILMFSLIPIIGLVSTVFLFLIQAYFAGFGNMDYTLERHFNYRDSVRFVKRNRGLATGNGIVFMLFLLIPIVGVVLILPLSVTAASVETIQLIHKEKNQSEIQKV